MLSVAILINGHPITARSAVNTNRARPDGRVEYRVDDGSIVLHDPADGAVALAALLLGTIKDHRREGAAARPGRKRLYLPLDLTSPAEVERVRGLLAARGYDADPGIVQYAYERWLDSPSGPTSMDREPTDEETATAIVGRLEVQWEALTPFVGQVWTTDGIGFPGVEGEYRWLEPGTPRARPEGTLRVGSGRLPVAGSAHPFDPFDAFGVTTLRGRLVNLVIPDVGRFPARISGRLDRPPPGAPLRGIRPPTVTFKATCPPVPVATEEELADALRTPIHDILRDHGHDELAGLALAAAVALVGFPKE